MQEIANELNKLAVEINSQTEAVNNLTKGLLDTSTNLSKGDKIERGFNFLLYQNLIYAFNRFYPFCLEEYLTQESKELYSSLKNELEEAKKILSNKEDMPEDLKNFLNQK